MQASKQTYPILLDCMPSYWPRGPKSSIETAPVRNRGRRGCPMVSSTQDDGPGTLHGQELVHLLRLQTSVDTQKGFFSLIKMFFFHQCGPQEKGTTTQTRNAGCWWTQKDVFSTKIKHIFDQYHQQMTPIPAERDMQVPGRLL